MGCDSAGKRFERFSPDLPYDFCAGVSVIENVLDKPFRDVPGVMRAELDKHLPIIEQWTTAYLKTYGRRTELRR